MTYHDGSCAKFSLAPAPFRITPPCVGLQLLSFTCWRRRGFCSFWGQAELAVLQSCFAQSPLFENEWLWLSLPSRHSCPWPPEELSVCPLVPCWNPRVTPQLESGPYLHLVTWAKPLMYVNFGFSPITWGWEWCLSPKELCG